MATAATTLSAQHLLNVLIEAGDDAGQVRLTDKALSRLRGKTGQTRNRSVQYELAHLIAVGSVARHFDQVTGQRILSVPSRVRV